MGINDILNSLIYDRTQADVDYALSLERESVYAEEDLKGAYNCSDRNRIGSAINYLADGVKLLGGNVKDNWVETDTAKTTDNANTIACLKRLRQILSFGAETDIPDDLDSLTYQKANAVERSLFETYSAYMWIADNMLLCGDGYSSDFDAYNHQMFDM